MAACVLDKKGREHLTMEDAGCEAVDQFATAVGVRLAHPTQWMQQSAGAPSQAASSKTPSAAVRKYNDQGKLTNSQEVLEGMGFKPGDKVQRSDTIAHIDAIQRDDVHLTVQEAGQDKKMLVSAASSIQGEWKVYSEPKPQTEIMWLSDAPTSCHEFKAAVLKAKIMTAMHDQCQALKGWGDLQMFMGPKAVKVAMAFPAKKLQLPCATTRVQLMDPSKTAPEGLIIGQFGTMVVVISGFTKIDKDGNGNGFQNPFWSIPRSTEPGDANMEVDLGVKCF